MPRVMVDYLSAWWKILHLYTFPIRIIDTRLVVLQLFSKSNCLVVKNDLPTAQCFQ